MKLMSALFMARLKNRGPLMSILNYLPDSVSSFTNSSFQSAAMV